MRLKRSRLDEYGYRKRVTEKDSEGTTFDTYSEAAAKFSGEVWPASGKVQAETYGERLSYIRNVRINAKYFNATDESGKAHYLVQGTGGSKAAYVTKNGKSYRSATGEKLTVVNAKGSLPSSLIDLQELDGLCLYTGATGQADYKIISVKPERFLRLEAEKL